MMCPAGHDLHNSCHILREIAAGADKGLLHICHVKNTHRPLAVRHCDHHPAAYFPCFLELFQESLCPCRLPDKCPHRRWDRSARERCRKHLLLSGQAPHKRSRRSGSPRSTPNLGRCWSLYRSEDEDALAISSPLIAHTKETYGAVAVLTV